MNNKELQRTQIAKVKQQIRESIGADEYIIHAISSIDELERLSEKLTKRVREWSMLHIPELTQNIDDNKTFLKLLLNKQPKELLQEFKTKETSGKILEGQNLQPILELALKATSLYAAKERTVKYLEQTLEKHCKNLHHLAGTNIAARLIKQAGSLRKLAIVPAGTIQTLGAEKALFRHLRSKAKPPKHGYIATHKLVQGVPKNIKGKRARVLADKLSLSAKLDYFKGEFLAEKYEKEVKKIK